MENKLLRPARKESSWVRLHCNKTLTGYLDSLSYQTYFIELFGTYSVVTMVMVLMLLLILIV